jgi:hypothetical protein
MLSYLFTEDWGSVVGACGHGFCADGDPDFDGTGEDLVGDLLDGEETGGTKAVCYTGGGSYGIAGCEDGRACHVALTWGEDVAETDIFDEGGVEVGLLADDLGVLVWEKGRGRKRTVSRAMSRSSMGVSFSAPFLAFVRGVRAA